MAIDFSETQALAATAALGSALAHAFMALFTKQAVDRLVFRAASLSFTALWLSPFLVISPPSSAEVFRYLLQGAVIFWVFNMVLIAAFERGDMSLVYPVMRGTAPVLAAGLAYIYLGESLGIWGVAGLALASTALIAFAWPRRDGKPKAAAIGLALTAACMTAAYTVNDAAGVRAADGPLVYAAWLFLFSAMTLTTTALLRRGRGALAAARACWRPALVSSFLNIATYGLFLYALSLGPVGPVSALRETSVVFGAILAAIVLKEPFGRIRAGLAILLAAGLVLLQAD